MTLLKTNSNKYKANFKKFATLEIQNYTELKNIDQFLVRFDHEYNFENNKKRYPNLQNRISQWLQGLPSGFSFCYSHEMLEFACLVHELPKIPVEKERAIIDNFYNHCAFMLLKLASKDIINQLY